LAAGQSEFSKSERKVARRLHEWFANLDRSGQQIRAAITQKLTSNGIGVGADGHPSAFYVRNN